MRLVLEQTPAESTSYRFARLDLHYFSPDSGQVVKGDIASGEVYYTNSTHLNVQAAMNPIERVTNEGSFPPPHRGRLDLPHLARRGTGRPKGAIADFVIKTFRYTYERPDRLLPRIHHLQRVPPDHPGARRTHVPYCDSDDVDGITRITGYFTKVSSWNKGKLGELKDRYRNKEFFGAQAEQRKAV